MTWVRRINLFLNVIEYPVQCEGLNASYAFTAPSLQTDTSHSTRHTGCQTVSWFREIAQTFLINLFELHFLHSVKYTPPNPPAPFPEKTLCECVYVCLCEGERSRKKERVECLLYQCFVNFFDALHMRAIGDVWGNC